VTTTSLIAVSAASGCNLTGAPIVGSGIDTDEIAVAKATTEAFIRQRANFPLVCGMSPREEKRRARRYQAAVKSDALRLLGIGALAAAILILSGPFAAVLAVLGAVFGWLLQNELNDRWSGMYAAAAGELA
jgi:hypothetical protein